MHKNPYHSPKAYMRAFPEAGADEVDFFASLLSGLPAASLLSLGCGYGRLEGQLDRMGFSIKGLDNSIPMLQEAKAAIPTGQLVAADMRALPFSSHPHFGAVISTLLSAAYIADESGFKRFLASATRLILPGGLMVLELPAAHRPRAMQGVEERTELEKDLEFRFRYFDVLCCSEQSAVLNTEMIIIMDGREYCRRAPLIVFTPDGIRNALIASGLTSVSFYAPYDLETKTDEPPEDCMRAIVAARKE